MGQLEKEQHPLDSVIYEVLEYLDPLLKERTIQIDILTDILPVPLDYLHVTRMLTTLLENAVRYSPPTSPFDLYTA